MDNERIATELLAAAEEIVWHRDRQKWIAKEFAEMVDEIYSGIDHLSIATIKAQNIRNDGEIVGVTPRQMAQMEKVSSKLGKLLKMADEAWNDAKRARMDWM